MCLPYLLMGWDGVTATAESLVGFFFVESKVLMVSSALIHAIYQILLFVVFYADIRNVIELITGL